MREFKLKRTLPEGTTRNVFHEVRHTEDLQLRNPNHLRMFYLDISTTKFSYASLKDFLLDCVGWYFYDRSAIKKLNDEGHSNSISTRAMRKMLSKGKPDQKGTGSELGEILLYAFLEDVYYSANDLTQHTLLDLASNIKEDRTSIDLLFGCLLEWGLPLSLPYTSEQIEGCTVHTYNDGDLIACFDENVPDSVIKTIARRQPLRAVFRDSSFADSPAKINVGEIFKLLAPDTRVKVI